MCVCVCVCVCVHVNMFACALHSPTPVCTSVLMFHSTYVSFTAFFLGGGPELLSEELIHSPEKRQRLRTEATGKVHLRIGVILRNFDKFGVEVT